MNLKVTAWLEENMWEVSGSFSQYSCCLLCVNLCSGSYPDTQSSKSSSCKRRNIKILSIIQGVK